MGLPSPPVAGYDLRECPYERTSAIAIMAACYYRWEFKFDVGLNKPPKVMYFGFYVADAVFRSKGIQIVEDLIQEHQPRLDRDLTTNQMSVSSWRAAADAAGRAVVHLHKKGLFAEAEILKKRQAEFERFSVPWLLRRKELHWQISEQEQRG